MSSSDRGYTRKDVLLYLLKRYFELYGPLYGRKKLQKLLFLVEHLDPNSNKLTQSTGITGYKFIIWFYGPFSSDIYKDIEELEEHGYIKEEVIGADSQPRVHNLSLVSYNDDGTSKVLYVYKPTLRLRAFLRNIRLPRKVRERIDRILREYGRLTPTEIEMLILKELKLNPEKKMQFMGRTVDEYIIKEVIKN